MALLILSVELTISNYSIEFKQFAIENVKQSKLNIINSQSRQTMDSRCYSRSSSYPRRKSHHTVQEYSTDFSKQKRSIFFLNKKMFKKIPPISWKRVEG